VAEDVGLVLQAEATAAKEWQAAHQQVRQLLFGEEEAEEEHSDEDDAKSEYYSGEEMLGSLKVNSKSFWRIQGRLAIDERLSSSSRNSDEARQRSVHLLGRDKHTAMATSTGSSRGSNHGSSGIASDCPGTPVTGCFANPPAAAIIPSSSSSSDGTAVDSSSIDCPSSSIATLDTAGRPLTTAIDSGADAQAPSVHLMLVMIKVPEVEAAASTETAQQPAAVEEEFNPVDWPVPVAKEPDQHSHGNRVVEYPTTQLQTSSSSKKPQHQTLIKKQQKQQQKQQQQQQQKQQQQQQQQKQQQQQQKQQQQPATATATAATE